VLVDTGILYAMADMEVVTHDESLTLFSLDHHFQDIAQYLDLSLARIFPKLEGFFHH
jgi:hypothetical protein